MVSLPPAHLVGHPAEKIAASARQVSRSALVVAKVGLWLTVVVTSLMAIAVFAIKLSPHQPPSAAQIKLRQQAIVRAEQINRERAQWRAQRAIIFKDALDGLTRPLPINDVPPPPTEPVAYR